ncbi:hypothetical protein GIB67_038316, partial [Kingdonia uniflora]
IAVVAVMAITTLLTSLIMFIVWKTSVWKIILFYTIRGVGLLLTELTEGIPPIFIHLTSITKSIHSVLIFVSIKYIPVTKVSEVERFLFEQVGPKDSRIFRCVVGYTDGIQALEEFESQLIETLIEFVRREQFIFEGETKEHIANHATSLMHSGMLVEGENLIKPSESPRVSLGSIRSISSDDIINEPITAAVEEIKFIQGAAGNGVVYLLGVTELISGPETSIFKRIIVNYVYNFLKRNLRQEEKTLSIPFQFL